MHHQPPALHAGLPCGAAHFIAIGQVACAEQGGTFGIGAVGELRLEKPLTTETWREESRQITWVQSDVRPVMYVTDPYSVVKVTGLAG